MLLGICLGFLPYLRMAELAVLLDPELLGRYLAIPLGFFITATFGVWDSCPSRPLFYESGLKILEN
jgi:hypothetical protein